MIKDEAGTAGVSGSCCASWRRSQHPRQQLLKLVRVGSDRRPSSLPRARCGAVQWLRRARVQIRHFLQPHRPRPFSSAIRRAARATRAGARTRCPWPRFRAWRRARRPLVRCLHRRASAGRQAGGATSTAASIRNSLACRSDSPCSSGSSIARSSSCWR